MAKNKDGKTMSRFEHSLRVNCVKVIDLILVTAAFALCWYFYYADEILTPYYFKGKLLIIFLFSVIFFFMSRVYDGFKISIYRISEVISSQMLGVMITDGIIYLIICAMVRRMVNILPGCLCLAVQIIIISLWAFLAHKWYFSVFPPQKSLVIYDIREGMDDLINEYGLSKKFDVKKSIHISEFDKSMLDEYDTVFLGGVHSRDRNRILKQCVECEKTLYIIPRIGDVLMSGADGIHMFHLPMLRAERCNPQAPYLFIKRIADIVISLVGLVITSPIMLITAIAIKTDGGPVFYKQERLTKNGKVFKILKFRSMRVDAEKDGVARLSTGENDDRITKVGRIIRKCRIDELPQLINILIGEMSVVGPRPERPEIAVEYEKSLPEFMLRLQVKAGLTGYAQVFGKYNTTPYDKLVMDLMYINHLGIMNDMRVLLGTVKILFQKESTEGVAEGQKTAMGCELGKNVLNQKTDDVDICK